MDKCMESRHSQLIDDYFDGLQACSESGSIIDVACGSGRNGLFLAHKGLPVVFADRSESALQSVEDSLGALSGKSRTWLVDLEQPNCNPFEGQQFGAAIVFRYLHRPLIPALQDAITPGGLLIYETFTEANRQFGRPNNPDFLLKPGELESWFKTWEPLHYFEGIETNPDRAIARIVCRKPCFPKER